MTNAFIQMSGVFAELELRIIRERVRSGMRNTRAKGIAALRCRWQIQQGRNFRSGRKTRGSAQARSVFRVPQGGSADRRPRLTNFPLTSFGTIRSIRREHSILRNWRGFAISAGPQRINTLDCWRDEKGRE